MGFIFFLYTLLLVMEDLLLWPIKRLTQEWELGRTLKGLAKSMKSWWNVWWIISVQPQTNFKTSWIRGKSLLLPICGFTGTNFGLKVNLYEKPIDYTPKSMQKVQIWGRSRSASLKKPTNKFRHILWRIKVMERGLFSLKYDLDDSIFHRVVTSSTQFDLIMAWACFFFQYVLNFPIS